MTSIIKEMKRVVASVTGDEEQANHVVYALINNFGGERLYMPTNDYASRNKEIKALHDAGAKESSLAKRYKLSAKTIRRIISA